VEKCSGNYKKMPDFMEAEYAGHGVRFLDGKQDISGYIKEAPCGKEKGGFGDFAEE
jgi:hypothetical protein